MSHGSEAKSARKSCTSKPGRRHHGILSSNIDRGSSGLKSRIFKILVGSEGTAFTIHEAHLCQSPVLERMCHGDFIESKTSEINLPEDDPKVFAAIGNYLYTGEMFQVEINNEPTPAADTTMVDTDDTDETAIECIEITRLLSDTYLAAEKWDLKDLKVLVVEKLSSITDVKRRPILFLITAVKLYASISDSDTAYRAFFRKTLSDLLNETRPDEMRDDLRETFDDCVSGGGNLAVDTVRALSSAHIEQLSASASEADARVAMQRKRTQSAESLTREYKGWYGLLRTNHAQYHSRCTSGCVPASAPAP